MKAKRVAKNFPIVCVDGSAGGLDAYTRLLGHLPANTERLLIQPNRVFIIPEQRDLHILGGMIVRKK